MTESWLELVAGGSRTRVPLDAALTRIGGPGCDVQVPDPGGDELHVWSDPPKAILVGRHTAPLLNGRAFEEAPLADGDSIQWGGAVLRYGRADPPPPAAPVLEELPELDPAPSPTRPAGSPAVGGRRTSDRLRAGLLVDLGLADRAVVGRWRDAVMRREFDADACAREILGASRVADDDPRLVERAGRLERDFLMAAYQRGVRGATRSVRVATKRGVAFLVANLVAIAIYTLVLVAILTLVRVQYGFSLDGAIDGILDRFQG